MSSISKIAGILVRDIASINGAHISKFKKICGVDIPCIAPFDIIISGAESVSFDIVLPSGKTIYVDWDDGGGLDTYNGTGSEQTVSNSYSSSGTYNCTISGDIDSIEQMYSFSEPQTEFNGDLARFLCNMHSLWYFNAGYEVSWKCNFVGLPISLTHFLITLGQNITGDLINLSYITFSELDLAENHNMLISEAIFPDCSGSVYAYSTNWGTEEGDRVIIGMSNAGCASGGYLWMYNGRSSASDTEATDLLAKGWTLDLGS